MTEDEAKTKWCPFVRINSISGDQFSFNRMDMTNAKNDSLEYRVGADLEIARCIGSLCMAWRWQNSLDGYCGLAGKP